MATNTNTDIQFFSVKIPSFSLSINQNVQILQKLDVSESAISYIILHKNQILSAIHLSKKYELTRIFAPVRSHLSWKNEFGTLGNRLEAVLNILLKFPVKMQIDDQSVFGSNVARNESYNFALNRLIVYKL